MYRPKNILCRANFFFTGLDPGQSLNVIWNYDLMGGKINETVKMVNNCKFHFIVRNDKGVTYLGL